MTLGKQQHPHLTRDWDLESPKALCQQRSPIAQLSQICVECSRCCLMYCCSARSHFCITLGSSCFFEEIELLSS